MKLNLETKTLISDAIRTYSEAKGVSLNEIARRSGINQANISMIVNRKGDVKDHWYYIIAEFIGYAIKKSYWQTVETAQFKSIIAHCDDARRDGKNRILVGETGSGKTYTVDRYIQANPGNTFKIRVSAAHQLKDIIHELMTGMGLDAVGRRVTKINNIARRFQYYQLQNLEPLLIVDEAENLRLNMYSMIKAIYDQLNGICPVVLLGTQQIITQIDRLRNNNKIGMPQFYRRFKAGIRELPVIDRTYKQFLDGIIDNELKKYLRMLCDNYGELNDYLEFALMEADRQGQDLTMGLFREIYNINKVAV